MANYLSLNRKKPVRLNPKSEKAKEEYQVKQELVNISYIVQVPTMRLLLSILNDSVFVSPFEPKKGYR